MWALIEMKQVKKKKITINLHITLNLLNEYERFRNHFYRIRILYLKSYLNKYS